MEKNDSQIFLNLGKQRMKTAGIFLCGFLSALGVLAGAALIWEGERTVKVHTLTQPLMIWNDHASGGLPTLPIGTTLYFDKSFPEGFTRYKVYVNVDRMPLTLRDLPDSTEIDPIEARAFEPVE